MFAKLADFAMRRRTPAARWGIAAAAFLAALGLRLALEAHLPPGFPFLTFFPAVIVTAFLCGARAGAAVAAASFLAAWWFFIPPTGAFALTAASATALAFFALIAAVDIALIHGLIRTLCRVEEERERNATLFTEMQHRISNNLAVVSALLALERRRVEDPAARRALDDAGRRLELVSRLHRRLHAPGAAMGPFLEELCRDVLEAGASRGVTCEVAAEPLPVTPAQAIPLALATAELLANAIEHAFPGRAAGRVAVALRREADGTAALTVQDDGVGLPPGFAAEEARSLGLSLVGQLARQLGGSFALEGAGGTLARLRFPLAPA